MRADNRSSRECISAHSAVSVAAKSSRCTSPAWNVTRLWTCTYSANAATFCGVSTTNVSIPLPSSDGTVDDSSGDNTTTLASPKRAE